MVRMEQELLPCRRNKISANDFETWHNTSVSKNFDADLLNDKAMFASLS